MTFTYSGNPGHSALDAVRFHLGDTDKTQPLLWDGEIDHLLQIHQNVPLAAAIEGCEAIMAKLARLVDEKVGQIQVTLSQRIEQYRVLQQTLRERLAINGAVPYAGGLSKSDKKANESNTDLVKPDFRKHMMENHQNSSFTGPGSRSEDGAGS